MLKPLLTALAIVGSSSVALADHPSTATSYASAYAPAYAGEVYARDRQVVVRDRDAYRAPRFDRRAERFDRDDLRFDDRGRRDRAYAPARRTTWLALTPQVHMHRGGQVFEVDRRERFAQLRLQNQHGRTAVERIIVEFANGEQQIVDGRRRPLDGNHAMIDIDLDGDGRRIDRVIVVGRSAPGASYQLYAM